jgi:hypothetical protein
MWKKFELYTISLFLLFLLLFINKVPVCFSNDCGFVGFKSLFSDHIVVSISVFFMVLSVVFYLRFNHKILDGATNLPVQVTKIENFNYESVTFLATYIVPLVCFDLDFNLDENRNLLMLFCVLILIGWIYLKTNMFYTNPTLAILGFHIYRIDTLKQHGIIVIVRGKVQKDNWLFCKHISDNIYYAKLKQ